MTQATAEKDAWLARFARLEREARGREPGWRLDLRREAIARFEASGFPSPRDEAWRHLPLGPIATTTFREAPAASEREAAAALAGSPLADLGGPRLVVVNGRYAAGLSRAAALPDGVWAGPLEEALSSRADEVREHLGRHADAGANPFVALNAAFGEGGAAIFVPGHAAVDEAIHVVHVTLGNGSPVATHPRTLAVIGDDARASIVETYLGPAGAAYLSNPVSEIAVGKNSGLDHHRVQADGVGAWHVAALAVEQDRDSRVASHNVSLGAAVFRCDLSSRLSGEGAEAVLNGLYVTDGARHADNHTSLDHAVPRCTSHELYKGILSGRSAAVFNGRIEVRPDAQKTDAKQANRNLLLADDAVVHTRPQLEIFANDVKCTHGATVGQLDPEALFYLRSRGIGEAEARRVLIRAFADDVISRMRLAALRARLEEAIRALIPGGGGAEETP